MTRALAAVLFVGAALQPAQACHKFTRWAYPWPQRCGLIIKPVRAAPPPPTTDWAITPELIENLERDRAIQELKERLQ